MNEKIKLCIDNAFYSTAMNANEGGEIEVHVMDDYIYFNSTESDIQIILSMEEMSVVWHFVTQVYHGEES